MIVWVSAEGDHTLIRNRPPLFLSGRAFTTQEIKDLQETVRIFRSLSWGELVRTLCEHLDWVTPTGRYKVGSCAQALRKLEALGLVKLPLRGAAWGREPVEGREAIRLWNEYVQRYHPLGYQRPFGAHQRYLLVGREGRRLGCLLFAAAAWALRERDRWIGW